MPGAAGALMIGRQKGKNMESKIYYTDEYTDENGKKWYCINGDTSYDLAHWSKEDAEKDYCSEAATLERQLDYMRAYGFYD